jgi:periplasmic divalent cation tolerance protein
MQSFEKDDFIFVYMTTESETEAARIGRILVEERLAACVNILPGMRSIYRWQQAIEDAAEVVCIAKTTAARFEALRARVAGLHSYKAPCIVALKLEAGDAPYLQWIAESVK